ncbi:MAG: histidine kinase [Bacteroides sp.]|nr:histidine kinase [Bacteroides sp.]
MSRLPVYIDICFCLIVLPAIMLMFPIERWYHHYHAYVIALCVWLYVVYIFNRSITIPWLFTTGVRKFTAISLLGLSLLITFGLSSIELLPPPPIRPYDDYVRIVPLAKPYQQAVWSLFIIVETFSFAVGIFRHTEKQRARQREVESQRDLAEINLYKAQIKPHFMFNTLNSLYGLFLTHDSKALPALEKFITMMRYVHTTASHEYVALDDEVDYIRQYVGLQSLRLNERTHVTLSIDVENPEAMIPPMLLMTFVENCFKHGVSPVEESTIEICISEKDGQLIFSTRNHVFDLRHIGEHQGIDNCKKRLLLSFPSAHKLNIRKEVGEFKVDLSIDFGKGFRNHEKSESNITNHKTRLS